MFGRPISEVHVHGRGLVDADPSTRHWCSSDCLYRSSRRRSKAFNQNPRPSNLAYQDMATVATLPPPDVVGDGFKDANDPTPIDDVRSVATSIRDLRAEVLSIQADLVRSQVDKKLLSQWEGVLKARSLAPLIHLPLTCSMTGSDV